MYNKKTQFVEVLLGGVDKIVSLLSIEKLSEKDQLAVVERFADIVLKRVLLRVSPEYTEEVKRVLVGENDGGMDTLVDLLERTIPNIDVCIQEEIQKTVADFRKMNP